MPGKKKLVDAMEAITARNESAIADAKAALNAGLPSIYLELSYVEQMASALKALEKGYTNVAEFILATAIRQFHSGYAGNAAVAAWSAKVDADAARFALVKKALSDEGYDVSETQLQDVM